MSSKRQRTKIDSLSLEESRRFEALKLAAAYHDLSTVDIVERAKQFEKFLAGK